MNSYQQNRRRDALDIALLMSQIKSMRQDIKNGNNIHENVEEKYEYLYEKTPATFMMIKDNSITDDQIPFLEYMMEQASIVQRGEADPYKTDVSIGKILADKYIEPVVKKTT